MENILDSNFIFLFMKNSPYNFEFYGPNRRWKFCEIFQIPWMNCQNYNPLLRSRQKLDQIHHGMLNFGEFWFIIINRTVKSIFLYFIKILLSKEIYIFWEPCSTLVCAKFKFVPFKTRICDQRFVLISHD